MAKKVFSIEDKRKKAIELAELMENSTTNIIKSDPWVKFQFDRDDEERKLKFTYGPVKKLFREIGLDVFKGEVKNEHLNNPETIVKILAAGLGLEDSEVENKLNLRYMAYYIYQITQAMNAVQPDISAIAKLTGEISEMIDGASEEVTEESDPLAVVDPPLNG